MKDVDLRERARSLREVIEAEADATEAGAALASGVVDALDNAGLFRLLVPQEFGGFEADVDTVIDVAEEISFADGSTGWAFAQNTTTSGYAAYLAPEFGREVGSARAAAGMFAPLGTLERSAGGYQVGGQFRFCSGAAHAEYIGGAGLVMEGGELAPFEGALPPILCFLVPIAKAELQGNWDVMGLRGTGSVDFEIAQQWVDEGWVFPLLEPPVRTGGAIYGLGPVGLGAIASTAWAIGVAARALHEIVELARGGRVRLGSAPLIEQPIFQRDLGRQIQSLDAARLLLRDSYKRAVAAWADGMRGPALIEMLHATRAAGTHVTQTAKAVTTFAWESSGSAGMRNPSILQRCFRDICVGSGHQVFDERNLVEVARARLGLDPSPF